MILSRLAGADANRELATEFIARHRIALRMAPRKFRGMGQQIHTYPRMVQDAYRRSQRETQGKQMNP